MTPAERPPFVLSRRGFLALGAGATAAAGLAACSSGSNPAPSATKIGPKSALVDQAEAIRRNASTPTSKVALTAQTGDIDLGGIQVRTWSFGELPGKEIRLKRGTILQAQLSNRLPQPTTVHWHGLALRNDMDGVPGVTQSEVAPGTDFTYEFA